MPQTQNATLQHNANKEQKIGIIDPVTKEKLKMAYTTENENYIQKFMALIA
jgi:hypothetical protein